MSASCACATIFSIFLMIQKDALNILKAGKNVYLTGAAGSGKTHTLNTYITYLKHRGVSVGVTASTGIAATHLGGTTIHSWAGTGIKNSLTEREIEDLVQKEYVWKRFDKAQVLVIDEVSMLSPALFDTVERVCRAMKRNEKPFGGMQVVLSGDFFQLPPITRGSENIEFINTSRAWKEMDVRVCYLGEQFRQKDDALLSLLNEMRAGAVSSETRNALAKCIMKERKEDIAPTRLYTHNADVDAENETELAKLPGKEKTYEMRTRGKRGIVETLKKSILAPEILKLKKDAVVMFVKNNFEEGYVNGTLGVVEDFAEGLPVVRTRSGKRIFVSEAEWEVEENGKVLGSVEQLPLRLAWAITIHKSQGMSMDAAEIDLSRAFVSGQGYVALSRLRTMDGLFLKGISEMAFAVHKEVAIFDKHLLAESRKWGKVIARFSNDELAKMHDDFVKASGGTVDEKEIEQNAKKEKAGPEEKISTYAKPRLLGSEGLSLKEIAKKRGMTISTIIAHLEKLKELGASNENFAMFAPSEEDLKKIRTAFSGMPDMKLAPVHEKLKGKYPYEELRLARLFM